MSYPKLESFLFLVMAASTAFAHGTEKAGPHGGEIQMPGGFHTEVVRAKDGTFNVYLLDVGLQNPTVMKSKVRVSTANDPSKWLDCKPVTNYFQCSVDSKVLGKHSILSMRVVRMDLPETEVKYNFPLRFGM